jgi:hypothetical protein
MRRFWPTFIFCSPSFGFLSDFTAFFDFAFLADFASGVPQSATLLYWIFEEAHRT